MGTRRQDTVAVAGRDDPPSGAWASTRTRTKAGLYRREVAPRHVVSIPTEILGGKLPITGHPPLVQGPHNLDTALATVEEGVWIPRHLSPKRQERRRLRVKGGK